MLFARYVAVALLTALMPGGLLYAAQKTHSHEQAKKELAHVLAQFGELAMDLLRLKAASDEATVAILDLPGLM